MSFARCCDTSRHKKNQVVHCASRPAAEVFVLRCWCNSGCGVAAAAAAAAAATSVVCEKMKKEERFRSAFRFLGC